VKKILAVAAIVLALTAAPGMAKAQGTIQDKTPDPTPATAQTKPTDTGVAGKWHFILDTPGGDRDVDAEFTVDADGKVSGTWGKSNAIGTYKDGNLSLDFSFYSDETSSTDQMKIAGKLDDTAALSGTWQFGEYDGAFKAIRPKN
jgi:hypothetical protein